MPTRFSRLPWLPCMIAGALAARLGAAVLVQHMVEKAPGRLCLIAGDAEGYWDLARHLSRGEDFAIYDPPRYVERMPGFPLLMAGGMKMFGQNVFGMRILLACVGTGACWLVYRLGSELVDRPTGIIAGVLAAVSPAFVGFSVLLLSETLSAFALLASLIAFAKLVKDDDAASAMRTRPAPGNETFHTNPKRERSSESTPSPALRIRIASDGEPDNKRTIRLALFTGLLCGAATLVRPTWLPMAPALGLLFLAFSRNRRKAWLQFALVMVGLSLALAPWTIRNALVTGHFIPTTLWMGPSLYDGLSPQATGVSSMQFVEADGWYSRPDVSEYEADRHYRQAAVEFARANPGRAFVLSLKKLWRFCNPFPNAEQFGDWTTWLAVGLFELPVLLLAALGFWQVRRSPRTWGLAAGPFLFFALVHTVFVGSLRYRLPVEYALLVLAAVGARWLMTKFAATRFVVPVQAVPGGH